jgi:pyrimidine-nucleoside phosphorylase
METLDEARKLASLMVDIGRLAGREVVTLLSDMNQPLGEAVGNSLEVIEAISTLHGHGPADFSEHCLHVSAHMLVLGHRTRDLESGRRMAEAVIASGAAMEKFRMLVKAQGGDVSFVDNPGKFPKVKFSEVVRAERGGYLSRVHARLIGEASVALGAGRARKGDAVDHAVGFILHHKVGERVEKDQPLITIHASEAKKLMEAREQVREAFIYSDEPVPPLPLFYE